MCLYGFAGTLLAYVAAVVIKSPIGAFSTVVISQFIIYLVSEVVLRAKPFAQHSFIALPRWVHRHSFLCSTISDFPYDECYRFRSWGGSTN